MSNLTPEFGSASTRLACAVAAVTTTTIITSTLLGAWHTRGTDLWLAASTQVMAEAAGCEQFSGAERQLRCKDEMVAARLPVESRWMPPAQR